MNILKKAFEKFIDAMRLPEYSDDEEYVDTCNNCDDTSDDEFLDDDDYTDICNDCDDTSNAEILSVVIENDEIVGIKIIKSDGHSRFLLCGQHNISYVLSKETRSLLTTKDPKSAT